MFRPLRSLLGLGLMLGALWAMFAIDLGGRTFAEHMDTISETPEAQELVEGTRSAVNPALQEVRDRVLGEYVEAPTWIPEDETVPAHTLEPDAGADPGAEPALPGQRRAPRPAFIEPDPGSVEPDPSSEPAPEPPLPGRRPPSALDEDPSLQPPLPGRG